MKKLLCVLIAVSLVSALFLIPASAATNVVGVEFKGEHIVPLASDDPAQLYDGAILSEADATAGDYNKAGILLVQNTDCKSGTPAEATIVFELDSVQSIDTVTLYWFCHGNSMIGLPTDGALIVGTSVDGNSFNEDAYTMDSTIEDINASFQRETVIDLGAPVDAKYVSVSFTMGAHGQTGNDWDVKVCWEWVGLTEVSASLKSAGNDNSIGEVSQEESVDLSTITPIVEIPEGASYIKHVPFNKSIVTDSNTIITDPTNLAAYNVAWSACVLLRPTETEGQYSVVEVYTGTGDYTFAFADVQKGDIALAVHGESTEPAANKTALAALVAGDIVYFAGYDMAGQTHETGAVVYYAVPAAGGEDVSDEVSDESEPADESTPAEDSEPADESESDSSVPATSDTDVSEDEKDDNKGGNTGLIIGIVVAVVVIAVVVVVVIVAKKKK